MMSQVLVLEQVLRRAPLALRCLDLVRGVAVTDGLTIKAWPLGAPRAAQHGERSPMSGIYGFRSLPGLRGYEEGTRPASDWCASPPYGGDPASDNFVVTIEDRHGRFLPQSLVLCLPKEKVVEVPLFSAPARSVPGGLAVVRGQLQLREGGTPAAWALVTASPDNATTYVTVADGRGMFSLFLPYASVLPPLEGSPPHGSGQLDQLTWPLSVQLFFQPTRQQPVADLPPAAPPEVRSILAQAAATVYDSPDSSNATIVRSLRLGQELVVATDGYSELLIDPA